LVPIPDRGALRLEQIFADVAQKMKMANEIGNVFENQRAC
jgi:hypothetical protein